MIQPLPTPDEELDALSKAGDIIRVPFSIRGTVEIGGALTKARGGQQRRTLAGWAATYGRLDDRGGLIPTVDREDQIFEAAGRAKAIDWQPYRQWGRGGGHPWGGFWNDRHLPIRVGVATDLAFHDATSELAKAHGKVGWFTAGHLFDRANPESWRGLRDGNGRPFEPSAQELDQADFYWQTAQTLSGSPRPLGFSADGVMALSKCRKRIVWARVVETAVCAVPMNPDATAEVVPWGQALRKAARGQDVDPLSILQRSVPGGRPCGACSCPPGVCAREPLLKGEQPVDQLILDTLGRLAAHFQSTMGLDEAAATELAAVFLGLTEQQA